MGATRERGPTPLIPDRTCMPLKLPHEVAGVEDDDYMEAVRASFPVPDTEAVRTPPQLGDTARAQPSREQDYGRGADHGR